MAGTAKMEKFSNWIIDYRWLLIMLLVLVTGILTYQLKNLTHNYEYEAWLPEKDRVAALIREVDKEFSTNMVVFTILEFKENSVFHPESLAEIKRMTKELEGIKEIFSVISLTNITDIRKTDDGIEVGDLIGDIPTTEEELSRLKDYVLSKEMYVNSVVSADAEYTVLISHLDTAYDELGVADMLLEKIKVIAGDLSYYFGGDPAMANYMRKYSAEDFSRLVPAMFVMMIFILGFGLRRFLGIILPLCFVFICIIWTYGIKALLNYPMNMLSVTVVVMLIALGSDYAVHIYNHFLRCRDVRLSTSEITLPVIMSAITTVIGLLTFSTTRIPNLKYFGIELGIGLGSACLVSIIFLPIGLYLLKAKPGPAQTFENYRDHIFSRVLARFGEWAFDHSLFILIINCIAMVVMGFGISRISTNVDFVELLPKESVPRKANNILEDHFSGMYPTNFYIRGDIKDPMVMDRMQYIENAMRSEKMLAGFSSLNGFVAEENWLLNGIYTIPETREGIANLWFMLEGEEMMKNIVTSDMRKSVITAFIKDSQSKILIDVSAALNQRFAKIISNEVVRIDPHLLAPESREQIWNLRLQDAARQITWLADYYNKALHYNEDPILKRLEQNFEKIDREMPGDDLWQSVQWYLNEETVEILPGDLVTGLMDYTKNRWQERGSPEFKSHLEQMIISSGTMNAEDAALTASGILKRLAFSFRKQRVMSLRDSLKGLFIPKLRKNKNFIKRLDGVLWGLWDTRPIFFKRQVESIEGIEKAVIDSISLKADPAGFPEILTRMEKLLMQSQYRSLFLASLAVFILISITQRSIRRGMVSLLAVLVPLEMIIGLMGWMGIPLDFGTVLFGALIVGLGIDGSIHFLHYYNHQRSLGAESRQALRLTMGHVGKAVVIANLTTCSGFMVLIFAHTSALRNFAYVSGSAILLVTVSILSFLPALVVQMRLDKEADKKK